MTVENALLEELTQREYEHGFVTDIEADAIAPGLSEEVVRLISSKKNEPEWLLEWRLKAYRHWLTLEEPNWHNVKYPPIDYQAAVYYSAAKRKPKLNSLDEVDPVLLETYEKLGIPLHEQKMLANVAVDAVFDSVSIATTYRETLEKHGVIFRPFSEAVHDHPELVKKYLGSVVPHSDNFYASLNSAVFSDGSFCYIPKGVRCPMELSTYFRINAQNTGQFERTLIIAEEGAYVSYLEGCTAPKRDEHQMHAAVVELVALDDAEIKYSTVQNWYPGDTEGKGGIYNFVTKRGACRGQNSKISWTQVETGSAITWKYPSVILQGDNSVGEFYSVAVTANHQQADTGTKMIHSGKNTKSTIISNGISAGVGQNSYRGEVHAIMCPNGSGKSTLAHVIAGRDDYEVTQGEILYNGKDLLGMEIEERAAEGVFLAYQYPVEIAGVSNKYFLRTAMNALRKYHGEPPIKRTEFLELLKENLDRLGMSKSMMERSVNEGFSGGEKKRNEILQMAMLQPKLAVLDETDSGLDIDALKIVADGVNALRSPQRATIIVTHYQRLLDYIVPDKVHVLAAGKIIRSGDKSLALELEDQGYGFLQELAVS